MNACFIVERKDKKIIDYYFYFKKSSLNVR